VCAGEKSSDMSEFDLLVEAYVALEVGGTVLASLELEGDIRYSGRTARGGENQRLSRREECCLFIGRVVEGETPRAVAVDRRDCHVSGQSV